MEIIKSNSAPKESGAHKSSFKMYTPEKKDLYDKKGVAVPMVVALISELHNYALRFHKPLKTIYLSELYWNEFEFWSRSHMTEQEADSNIKMWSWAGREIKKMSKSHVIREKTGNSNFDWDFHIDK